MNTDIPVYWSSVTPAQFEQILTTMDYYRSAWSKAIDYLEKPSGRLFAVLVSDDRRPNGPIYVRPDLIRENAP